MKKKLTLENYYEFPFQSNTLVGIWFKTQELAYPKSEFLSDLEQAVYRQLREVCPSNADLAIWIAENIPDVSAVHIQDATTSWGAIVYVDWP